MHRRKFIQTSGYGIGSILAMSPINPLLENDTGNNTDKIYPFLWGTQYYRAPTPEPRTWNADLRKMKKMGFNHVKFWVQWRWSHLNKNTFYFEDLKKLMELAEENRIYVTLNTIFDVSPHWLFEKYPDARQIMNNGRIVEPYVVGHRQIGGHPGPCYNHPGALEARRDFLSAAIDALKGYSALGMWDVWNEPELSYPQRDPINEDKLVCYCRHCHEKFIEYLKNKYVDLQTLNKKWGRNYQLWKQVEIPRSRAAFLDFVDWREFHIETITREAAWRIEMVRQKDPERVVYLHVVPNTLKPFNAITTCTDDFQVSKLCDVFAATMHGGPFFTPQVISAAQGKLCYNVESHINAGSTFMHQKVNDLEALLKDFIPQLALGIKGFLFWQFRPEVLGSESPGWGLVNLDGSDREITRAANAFWETISPYTREILESTPSDPEIAIWKSRKNEIFQYCVYNSLDPLIENINGYSELLYWNGYSYRFISEDILAEGKMDGIKVLIMPSAYYLTQEEADALVRWVRKGGVLLAEAHLGGYNGNTGRHNRIIPGNGLSEAFGFEETVTTASYHLNLGKADAFHGETTADTKKALEAIGISGGKFFPIRLTGSKIIWGAMRYAELSGSDLEIEGCFANGEPCAVSKRIDKGHVFYFGSRLGMGFQKGSEGLLGIIEKICNKAGAGKILEANASGKDKLFMGTLTKNNRVSFIGIQSRSDKNIFLDLSGEGDFKGIFSEMRFSLTEKTSLELPPNFTDLFARL